MNTSEKGLAALEFEEGLVLRSYLCPAGKWTIGIGITSAAGVGKIGPRMQITVEQARAMARTALAKTYEHAVERAMPGAVQNEFDAGVLFHWNTGAIGRASWVEAWRRKLTRPEIARRFLLWSRAKGKVIQGLSLRRERELRILFDAVYPKSRKTSATPPTDQASTDQTANGVPERASWSVPVTPDQRMAFFDALVRLGYLSRPVPAFIPSDVVKLFQADHALTVDGVIGRATLSTAQRRMDAQKKAVPAATAGASGAAASASGADQSMVGFPHAGLLLLAFGVLFGLYLCWRYRDVLAVKVQRSAPRLATLLRSF